MTLVEKILAAHAEKGELVPAEEVRKGILETQRRMVAAVESFRVSETAKAQNAEQSVWIDKLVDRFRKAMAQEFKTA